MNTCQKIASVCLAFIAPMLQASELPGTRLSHLPIPESITFSKSFRQLTSRRLVSARTDDLDAIRNQDARWQKMGRTFFQNGNDMSDQELDVHQPFCWIDPDDSSKATSMSDLTEFPKTFRVDLFGPAYASDEAGLQTLATRFPSQNAFITTIVGEAATLYVYDSKQINTIGCLGTFTVMHHRAFRGGDASLALFATPTYADFKRSFGSYAALNFPK